MVLTPMSGPQLRDGLRLVLCASAGPKAASGQLSALSSKMCVGRAGIEPAFSRASRSNATPHGLRLRSA